MEPLLRVEGLTKRFGQVVANDQISFDVRSGEIHCLLGENGAGKTTLAECLYGFLRPDAGNIYWKGRPVKVSSPRDAIRLGIGMVHQHFALVQPLTVVENVMLATPEAGMMLNLKKAEEILAATCDRYGICLDLKARMWQLSVGEQQWTEILKSLHRGPKLLILDEPTAVLTPQETEQFFATLAQMTSLGLSIILITHKLNEVKRVSDRVTVLRKGRLIATVNTADVTKADLARTMVGREVQFEVTKTGAPGVETVLEIRDLRAVGDRGQDALCGISLEVHKGEILGLAGVSGNGQKELFEVIAGVRPASGGSVVVAGGDVTNLSVSQRMARGVGHIPEDRLREGVVPEFDVAENLLLGRQGFQPFRRGPFLDRAQIRSFASECVSAFHIATPSLSHATALLSGGNIQKIILARELTQCPVCLLANQPTRGLDIGVIEYVHDCLLEKRSEGIGILLCSEDLDEIMDLSDRIAVIFKGQIVGIVDARQATLEQIGLLMAGCVDEVTG